MRESGCGTRQCKPGARNYFDTFAAGKSQNITIFIVGHVTKEGNVAGPRMLEHMVDTVLYFEGDKTAMYRMFRVSKPFWFDKRSRCF
ncbi:MAG: hypothetical protein ACLSD6_03420 [Clostridium sp.]